MNIENDGKASAKIYFEELSTLVPELSPRSLFGVFPRYLRRKVPGGKVPISVFDNKAAFAIGGVPLRRPEAEFHWLFGERNAATSGLFQFMRHSLKNPRICFPPSIVDLALEHFPASTLSADHFVLCQHDSSPQLEAGIKVQTFDHFPSGLNLNDELKAKLPPEEIWSECGFMYAGLEVDGEVQSLAEFTVDDGDFCVIQQVYTTKKSRQRGFARTLVASLSSALIKQDIVPLMQISDRNTPSKKLAKACGFEVAETFLVIEG